MLIQAAYPLSFTARVLKWAMYGGLILLLIVRPVRLDNWLNSHITSWAAVSLFIGLGAICLAILLNYSYLFSYKTKLQIGSQLRWQDPQGKYWAIPLTEVETLTIQHSKKSGEIVLDVRYLQTNTRLLLCENWFFYTLTNQGYQRTMCKVREVTQLDNSFSEKASVQEVLYINKYTERQV